LAAERPLLPLPWLLPGGPLAGGADGASWLAGEGLVGADALV
jgi:hypothetical protein